MIEKTLREARQMSFDELYRLPQAEDSLAIDTFFPEKFADELSRYETFNKHLFRPNTYLHKWWARRCGSTFRTILKQFVPDPTRRDYYAPGGLEGKIVLDPMMGGGTTLHEAIRLGANVIGADIDPIPVAQARATLTPVALKELRAAFDQFFASLYSSIGQYFQTECPECGKTLDAQYTLHGLRKYCNCGEIVQIDQYELRHEANRTLRIWPESWGITDSRCSLTGSSKRPRLVTKAETRCPFCGQKYKEMLDLPYYARYVPLAVAGTCPQHGFLIRSPSEADSQRIREADGRRRGLDWGPAENFAVKDGPKSGDLLGRNIRSYLDVFTSRQLLYLDQAIQLLRGYEGAIKLNLALLVSTSLEFNSLLCGYKGWFKNRPGAIRHVFALHAYSFVTGRQAFWLIHGDSRHLPISDHSIDFIVTDPPYYDSVQYSDLATFFRVWLARLLPSEINWAYNESDSAVAIQATDGDTSFTKVLSGIFQECGRVLKPCTGRLVFTFHHWDANAWAELTIALKHASFRLRNAYVVFSEHPISVHIRNLRAIKHDAILVLANDKDEPVGQWPPSESIRASESEAFCRQCSAVLGWLLESPFSPTEIRTIWKKIINWEV